MKKRRREVEKSPWQRLSEAERTTLHDSGACWSPCEVCKRDEDMTKNPPCRRCGGPHAFDTSVPSPLWNRVIRPAGLPDYLCLSCITWAFVRVGQSFSAELSGHGVWGASITVSVFSPGLDTLRALRRSREGL